MNVEEVIRYLKVIHKWWWVIILLVGVTISTMLVIAFSSEKEYRATVTIQISAPPPQEVPLYSNFGRQALSEEIAQTRANFSEFLREGEVIEKALEALPAVRVNREKLHEKLAVEIPENSQLMRISLLALDSESAAELANTVVTLGLREYGRLQARSAANQRQFIEQELAVLSAELKTAEAELAQFQIDNKIGTLGRAIDRQYDLIKSLQSESDLAKAEGNMTKARELDQIILLREAELQDLLGISGEYQELVARVEQARASRDFLYDRQTEARIKEGQILDMGSIQVITPARPPRRPVPAINSKLIILGVAVSFAAGILLSFILEYMRLSGAFDLLKEEAKQTEMTVLSDNLG